MKKKNCQKSIILATSLLVASTAFSQTSASGNSNEIKNIKIATKEPRKDVSNRPKAPSMQHIDCMYADGNLYVTFAIPEGECTMTVTNQETGISLQYMFPTEESAEINVGTISSAYIELNTENGHSYEGWIE